MGWWGPCWAQPGFDFGLQLQESLHPLTGGELFRLLLTCGNNFLSFSILGWWPSGYEGRAGAAADG